MLEIKKVYVVANLFKGMVRPIMKILSSFMTLTPNVNVILNPKTDFLPKSTKRNVRRNVQAAFFP